MKSKLLGIFGRIAVSLGSIAFLIYFLRDKISGAVVILKTDVIWLFFAEATAVYFVLLVLLSVRLQVIFRVQKILMNFAESLYLNFLGLFFNLFLPSAVGGDVVKAYYAYKHSGKKIESTTSVLLDRFLGFVVISLMAVGALLFSHRRIGIPQVDSIIYGFWGLMLFSMIFLASKRFAKSFDFLRFLLPKRVREILSRCYHAIYNYKNHASTLVFVLLLSFLIQCFAILAYHLISRSLGQSLSFGVFFILVPVITIVSMAPSLGGLGVREAGSIYLFSRFMPTERAIALSLLLDLILYGYSFAGGIAYAVYGGFKPQQLTEMEESNGS